MVAHFYSQQAGRGQTTFIPKRRWENEMKMNLKVLFCEDVG
jgi:hypothetical protein